MEQRFWSRTSAPSIKLPGAPTEQSHSRKLSAFASSPSTFPCATRIEPPPGVEEAEEKEEEDDEGELAADSRCSEGGGSCARVSSRKDKEPLSPSCDALYLHASAYVSIRQHTSAYVSLRSG